jgi:hypothetical protein
LLPIAALLAVLMPAGLRAQEDPNEIPLGDVARNLRKNTPAAKPVIDDDNLSEVMAEADSRQKFSSALRYVMSGESKGFQVSAPDVTCSLAFTASVKSLLSTPQYSEMDLPASDLAKLEGRATIEGDALTVTLFNATTWHVSEIAVAFTVVRKSVSGQGAPTDNALDQLRPEKKRDTTVIYRMRAAAAPWIRAAFSAQLDVPVDPGDEWHWAIVQAKGYPPQPDASVTTPATGDGTPAIQPVSAPANPATNAQPAASRHPEAP